MTHPPDAPQDNDAGSELAPVSDGGQSSTPSRAVVALWEADQLARVIAGTPFVPVAYRGRPEAVAGALLYGQELGLEPLTALQLVDVVEGRPQLSSIGARGLVLAAGHELEILESSGRSCAVRGRRRGVTQWTHVAWTWEMADAAGLTRKPNWRDYPRAMLTARATLELCRIVFPDVLYGLQRPPAPTAQPDTEPASLPAPPRPPIPADPWAAAPPSDEAAETVLLTATPGQLTKLALMFDQVAGVSSREERHYFARMLTGYDFDDTTKNLPRSVASRLIDDLEQLQQTARARELDQTGGRALLEDLAADRTAEVAS